MAKTLELRFLTSDGKPKALSLSEPVLNLDAATVQTAMNQIVSQGLFEKDGIHLFQSVKGARYVERITTDIFDIVE